MLLEFLKLVGNLMRQRDLETIAINMIACIIIYNMIIEDEQDLGLEQVFGNNVGVGQIEK